MEKMNQQLTLYTYYFQGEKYTKPSLKKYSKIGTDVANNFYEKDEDDVRNCSEETKEDNIEDDSSSDSSELSDMDEEEISNSSNDSEEEEISNSSNDSEEESSSSDSMPLPLFLLNKNSMDYPPMDVNPLPTKTEHQTRKSTIHFIIINSICKVKR